MGNRRIEYLLEQAKRNENESSVSSAKRQLPDAGEAQRFFLDRKTALLNIQEWDENSALSSFKLFTEDGRESSNKTIIKDAFLRISLPGSGKDDWVRVVDIYESDDEFVITVRPTYDPTVENSEKNVTSHFFTSESANNFCLLRDDKSVSIYVIGLNERQNTTETSNPLETVRNVATANLGSYLGVQKLEWTTYCKNFLNPEERGRPK